MKDTIITQSFANQKGIFHVTCKLEGVPHITLTADRSDCLEADSAAGCIINFLQCGFPRVVIGLKSWAPFSSEGANLIAKQMERSFRDFSISKKDTFTWIVESKPYEKPGD